MKILYLADKEGFNQKHFDKFSGSLTRGQSIVIYDPDKPDEPQFEGVGFVMDPGGACGTVERIDAAKAANVALWQVTTTGLDDVNLAYFLEKGMTLAHSPGTLSAVPLAEHALMWILSFAKNVVSNNLSRISKEHSVRWFVIFPKSIVFVSFNSVAPESAATGIQGVSLFHQKLCGF